MIVDALKEKISVRVRLSIKSFLLVIVVSFGCLDIYSRAHTVDVAVKKLDSAYKKMVEADSFYDTAEDIISNYLRSVVDSSFFPSRKLEAVLDTLRKTIENRNILPGELKNSIVADMDRARSSLEQAYFYAGQGKSKEARHHLYKSALSMSLIHETLKGLDNAADTEFQNLRKKVRADIVGSPQEQLLVLMTCLLFVMVLGLSFILDILIPLKKVSERMVLASRDPAHAKKYIEKRPRLDELGIIQISLNKLLTEVEHSIKRSSDAEALAQQRLAAIEVSKDGIGIVSKDGMLTYANRSLFDLHGIAREDIGRYLNHPWTGLYTEAGQGDIERQVLPEIEKNGFWHGASDLVRKDGAVIIAELSLTRLTDGGLIGTARDITERVRTAEEKDKLQQQVLDVQKLESVGRLTGGIAHDFNNMLTIINGNLDMAADPGAPDSESAKYIKIAKRAVLRGSELTQRLLAFSRNQTLKPKIVNLNVVIPEATMMMIRAIGENVEIIFDLAEGLSLTKIDIGQFENALVNLAINARDAMPDGGYIKIKTQNRTLTNCDILHQGKILPGDYAMVEISDTGCGIPDDLISKIFDPFFTTKDIGEGSGLGLSMVYGFVKQSHGHIIVNSKVGVGTAVRLFFPVTDQLETIEKKHESTDQDIEMSKALRGDKTILIVEDEDEILKLNHDILNRLGYKIFCAANAHDALSLVKKGTQIDLLITDIIMPGKMNGYELAYEVKAYIPAIKTLFISGYAPTQLLKIGSAPASIDLLAKPYIRGQLIRRVRLALEKDLLDRADN